MNGPSKAGLAILVLAAGLLTSAPVIADGPRGHARIGVGVHRGAPAPAHVHRRHYGSGVRFGVFAGAPLLWGSYYGRPPYYSYPPYYSPYYPPVVTVPVSPPTYVEQSQVGAAPPSAAPEPGYWYYCADSRAYYPYVKECAGGWQRVSPQPPPG